MLGRALGNKASQISALNWKTLNQNVWKINIGAERREPHYSCVCLKHTGSPQKVPLSNLHYKSPTSPTQPTVFAKLRSMWQIWCNPSPFWIPPHFEQCFLSPTLLTQNPSYFHCTTFCKVETSWIYLTDDIQYINLWKNRCQCLPGNPDAKPAKTLAKDVVVQSIAQWRSQGLLVSHAVEW